MLPDFTSCTPSKDNSLSSFSRSDAVLAEYIRQKVRKDLSRWSRKVLMCLGLENIGKHIVGESKWEKLYDNGCKSRKRSTSPPEVEQEEDREVNSMDPSSMDETPPPFHSLSEKDKNSEACPLKEDGEDAEEEGEDQEPAEEADETTPHPGDREDDNEHEHHSNSPGTPESSSVQMDKVEGRKEDVDCNMVLTGSNDSSNHSFVGDGPPINNTAPREEDEQNTSRSGSRSSPEADEREEASHSSPAGSEQVDLDDCGGGNLANNLFQILPYWYFLNRAFSISAADGGGGTGTSSSPSFEGIKGERLNALNGSRDTEDRDDEEEDEDEEMASVEPAVPPINALLNEEESRSPDTTQRINSLILLESLQQRLRTQEQGASGDMSAVNHSLYLSHLLSRMAGREDTGSRNGTLPSSSNRDHLAEQVHSSPLPDHVMDEQPLDLRSSTLKERAEEEGDNRRRRDAVVVDAYPGHTGSLTTLPYMLDEQTSKVFRSNPRSSKGYTAQELQAALHDIQSGKLGTRRAAVIYGIPRSTLRNKVYKLGKDRGRSLQMAGGQSATDFLHMNNNNNTLRGKEQAMRKELLGKLSHFRPLSEGYQNPSSMEPETSSFVAHHGNASPSPSSSVFPHMNGEHETKLDHVAPSLSHLILKHAQAQKRAQQSLQNRCPTLPLSMETDDLRGSSYKNVDQHGPSTFLGGKDWKEALTRHELLMQHDRRHHPSGAIARAPPSQAHHLGSDDASSSMDLAGKKSRPKRGKYRNYDREALVKAVRAVQNGEMSVHRAGSFFGVPHSTLEYKVKERHLLRRPKRKELTSPLTQTKLSSAANESSSESGMMTSAHHNLVGRGEDQTSSSSTSFAKIGPKSDRFLGGATGGTGSSSYPPSQNSHLFPVTTDLRESLSRYLNSEHGQNEVGDQDGFDSEDGGGGRNCSPSPHLRGGASLGEESSHRRKEENGEGNGSGGKPSSLGGLIGNRLTDLFQLSDIFFRTGGSGESPPANREALLDLSKK